MSVSVILPVLALAAGILSLFLDPKDPRKRYLIYVMIPVMVLACGLQIHSTRHDVAEAEKRQKEAEDSKKKSDADMEEIKNNTQMISQLLLNGWSAERVARLAAKPQDFPSVARQSLQAVAELKKSSSAGTTATTGQITVEYFPKDVDRNKVEAVLRDLGFRLVAGHTQVPDVATNSIWFGTSVRIDDVKRVAYVLLGAGVQLKAIRLFRYARSAHASLIQVGSDRLIEARPPMTVDEIRNATGFPQDRI